MHKQFAANGIDDMHYQGLSSAILSEISNRKCGNRIDLLAIMGNCCAYGVRLDPQRLQNLASYSLSVCILTLFFMNGELFWNGRASGYKNRTLARDPRPETAVEYLRKISLRMALPAQGKQLTLMKRLRLPDVKLCRLGVQSKGWLWELGKPISFHCAEVARWRRRRARSQSSKLPLSVCRKQFKILATYLHRRGCRRLAKDITRWSTGGRDHLPSQEFQTSTAIRLVERLQHDTVMRLGRVRGEEDYRALFLTKREDAYKDILMLTCWSRSKRILDKYVSLQVRQSGIHEGCPMLETMQWSDGFWFAENRSRTEVIIPWPYGTC
jgi:hypothetical protein